MIQNATQSSFRFPFSNLVGYIYHIYITGELFIKIHPFILGFIRYLINNPNVGILLIILLLIGGAVIYSIVFLSRKIDDLKKSFNRFNRIEKLNNGKKKLKNKRGTRKTRPD